MKRWIKSIFSVPLPLIGCFPVMSCNKGNPSIPTTDYKIVVDRDDVILSSYIAKPGENLCIYLKSTGLAYWLNRLDAVYVGNTKLTEEQYEYAEIDNSSHKSTKKHNSDVWHARLSIDKSLITGDIHITPHMSPITFKAMADLSGSPEAEQDVSINHSEISINALSPFNYTFQIIPKPKHQYKEKYWCFQSAEVLDSDEHVIPHTFHVVGDPTCAQLMIKSENVRSNIYIHFTLVDLSPRAHFYIDDDSSVFFDEQMDSTKDYIFRYEDHKEIFDSTKKYSAFEVLYSDPKETTDWQKLPSKYYEINATEHIITIHKEATPFHIKLLFYPRAKEGCTFENETWENLFYYCWGGNELDVIPRLKNIYGDSSEGDNQFLGKIRTVKWCGIPHKVRVVGVNFDCQIPNPGGGVIEDTNALTFEFLNVLTQKNGEPFKVSYCSNEKLLAVEYQGNCKYWQCIPKPTESNGSVADYEFHQPTMSKPKILLNDLTFIKDMEGSVRDHLRRASKERITDSGWAQCEREVWRHEYITDDYMSIPTATEIGGHTGEDGAQGDGYWKWGRVYPYYEGTYIDDGPDPRRKKTVAGTNTPSSYFTSSPSYDLVRWHREKDEFVPTMIKNVWLEGQLAREYEYDEDYLAPLFCL